MTGRQFKAWRQELDITRAAVARRFGRSHSWARGLENEYLDRQVPGLTEMAVGFVTLLLTLGLECTEDW